MAEAEQLLSQTVNGSEGAEVSVECSSCNSTTFHRVIASAETIHSIADDAGRVTNDHQIIQCQGCKTMSFRSRWTIGDTDAAKPMVENVDLYPRRRDKSKRAMMDSASPAQICSTRLS